MSLDQSPSTQTPDVAGYVAAAVIEAAATACEKSLDAQGMKPAWVRGDLRQLDGECDLDIVAGYDDGWRVGASVPRAVASASTPQEIGEQAAGLIAPIRRNQVANNG